MILDKWLRSGKLLVDEGNSQHHVYTSKVGESNIDIGSGVYVPYVLDIPNKKARFGSCEIRYVSGALEFWAAGEKLNTLTFNPEIFTGGVWTRKILAKGVPSFVQNEDTAILNYTVASEDMSCSISMIFGRTNKIHLNLSLSALEAGEQRIVFDFSEKGTPIIRKNRELQDVMSGIEFSKSKWQWKLEEVSEHEEIPDITVTKLSVKHKVYAKGEISNLSPDTWGPTAIVADADDGHQQSGGAWDADGDGGDIWIGDNYSELFRYGIGLSWTLPAIGATDTINKCYVRLYCNNYNTGAAGCTIYYGVQNVDPASAVVWSAGNLPYSATLTVNHSTTFRGNHQFAWFFGESDNDPINMAQDFQDLLTDYGAISAEDRANFALLGYTTNVDLVYFEDSSAAGSDEPELYLDWTVGATSSEYVMVTL